MKFGKRFASVILLLGTGGAQCLTASIVVTPSAPQLHPGQGIQFSATGSTSSVYVWSLSGSGCQGASCGLITSNGLYTAPSVAPSPDTVTVTATSLSDVSQFGSTTVTIAGSPVVSVSLSPQQVTIPLGSKQQFTPTVNGTSNTAVTWALSGYGCTGATCGTISSGGLYTAPTTVPNTGIVFVTATSSADNTKSATSTVYFTTAGITVSVTPSPVTLKLGASQQFKATVTGTSNTAVTWSLKGTGCTGAACGIISTAGLYTAPKTAINPPTVTVIATSSAESSATGDATVTLQVPLAVTISPTAATLVAGGQFQFKDTVVGSTNTAVTWSVSGADCTGTACGTISSSGLYAAPATISAQLEVTVKVTTQATPSVSATAGVTVLVSNDAKLFGHYAFLFNGFNTNGIYQVAGSIQADGKGTIPSGTEDVNDTINPAPALSITGTYGLTSDNRGTLTIKGPLTTQTFCIALDASGASGTLISCDESGIRGSGRIYLQNAASFTATAFTGGYAVSLTGSTLAGSRLGILGSFFPNGAGTLIGANLDVNEGGVVSPTFPSFQGSYVVSTTGRGTMTWKVPGFDGGTSHFALYVVSRQRVLLISMDPLSSTNPIFSGPAVFETGLPFQETSFSGGSVFSLAGVVNGKTDNEVGRIQFGPNGDAQLIDDHNSAGKVTLGEVSSGAYDLGISGRGDLNLDCGCAWIFYATGPNQGFLMDTSSEVRMGEMLPQVQMASTNSSLLNAYMLGSEDSLVMANSLYSGSIDLSAGTSILGSGTAAGTLDISQASAFSLNHAIQGTYSVLSTSDNGHGFVDLTAPQKMTISVWVAGPSKALGLQVDSGVSDTTVLDIEQ